MGIYFILIYNHNKLIGFMKFKFRNQINNNDRKFIL